MGRRPHLRDYLTRREILALLRAAKHSPRYGARNYAMILLAWRHGLRASEVTGLRLSDVDLAAGTVYCRRAKHSNSTLHPLKRDEIEALQHALSARRVRSEYLFHSERGARLTRNAFWRIVSDAGERANLPVKTYAHQLRHSCGFYLANKGCDLRLIQDYLGHRMVQNTVRYTALNHSRFRGLW